MSPQIATWAFALLIGGLLYLDVRRRGAISPASWLVVIWVLILATRPVSAWLGVEHEAETTDDYVEGSSIDRNVFVLLLLAGLWVLRRRNVNWHTLIANNRWLFGFYLFFGLSMIWSDYSFVSLKRW